MDRNDRGVSPPGEPSAVLDADTMPVQMVRTVAPVSGVPAEFTIEQIPWKERTSGNNDTNPVPSIWKDNRKIRDLAFHQDRIIFMRDERIVMSQTSDLFNVFKEDAANAAASAPIDVGLSSEQVKARLKAAVPEYRPWQDDSPGASPVTVSR